MISSLLLLCIRISVFDTALVYDSKSCSTQYITLHAIFGLFFCGWTHSAPNWQWEMVLEENKEAVSCRGFYYTCPEDDKSWPKCGSLACLLLFPSLKAHYAFWVSSCTFYFCYGLCRKMFWTVSEIRTCLHTRTQLAVERTKKLFLSEFREGAWGSCCVSPCPWVTTLCIFSTAAPCSVCDSQLQGAMGWCGICCTQRSTTAPTCHGPASSLPPAT